MLEEFVLNEVITVSWQRYGKNITHLYFGIPKLRVIT